MLIYSRRKDLPYKTLFQFREGKDDPKRKTWDRIQRRAKEDQQMSTRIERN
jgi:hypothetical protein